ncbi:MAG: hypothetical protein U0452_14205 [Anaerolineae bacterium]
MADWSVCAVPRGKLRPSGLIGGTAWEDAARVFGEANAKAGLATEERIREAETTMLNELLAAPEAHE